MQRLATAAVGVPLILLALFWLPDWWFFVVIAAIVEGAVWEYVAIAKKRAPHAPLALLLAFVPLAAAGLYMALESERAITHFELLASATALSVGLGTLLLFSRTPVEESIATLGIFGFGIPYLAVPIASLTSLKRIDPWLVFLLFAIVWLGDTAAYYAGSRLGRHKMAPVVSPKKSWEGAAAGLATSLAAAAVWSLWRQRGELSAAFLVMAGATAVAAQVGDLVESMIKRDAGVKDSGHVLPGHGGFLDRIDALMFAAPVMLLGVWLLGIAAR
jgi:phosphatidate cytidylyltransferase